MRRFLTIALLSLLAACAGPPPGPPPVPPTVTVQRGDTVYGIARRFDIPQRDLIQANGLEAPYLLLVGQVLRLPPPRLYTVRDGDTLYGISRQYDVDVSELARINELLPPYSIYVGQQLRLPAAGSATTVARAPSGPPPSQAQLRAEIVARAPAAGPGPAMRNPAPAPAPARTASPPAAASAPPVASAPTPAPSRAASQPPASTPTPTRSGSAGGATVAQIPAPVPSRRPEQSQPPVRTVAVAPPPAPAAPARAASRFAWPVNGEIVSGFGPKGSGVHNDGINIAAERGTPVRAASNGVVAYAGNELRGYGNLVLIRHADGWVTAYGHNDRILVSRGEQVDAGQPIATVGSTGAVGTPQLHFEIRRGTEALDPLKHLPTPRG